jgi:hypothetical protein
MIVNPLPPQAYTKETLVAAYEWIQIQPDHIKEMATSPEMLVSMFMKSKMQGNDCFDRPSIQNFKKELKTLAGIVGEFSQPMAAKPDLKPDLKFEPKSDIKPEVKTIDKQGFQLDSKSISMIQEVKTQFNLSSDQEALRMIISVGHQKVLQILSK